jgi:DNA polymerase III epsilon subunit-like protein
MKTMEGLAMTEYVFDIEADGIDATKIHCMIVNGEEVNRFFFKNLTSDDVLIGHNIIRYDIPTIERLLNIKIKAQLIDTLALSWYLFPTINRHGLEQWGERLNIEKPVITDWENLTREEYIHRCKEDVKINTKLWGLQKSLLIKIYDGNYQPLVRYLSFKMKMGMLQETSRWKLDVDKANTLLNELELKNEQAINELSKVMPTVPKIAKRKRPKLPFKQDGSLSVAGERWKVLAEDNGFTIEYDHEIEEVVGQEEPNPTSSKQIKDWLFTLGWKPMTFNFVDDREIPQVKTKDGELCKSIKKLSDLHPEVLVLDSMAVVKHRIGLVKGLLKNEQNGFVQACIQGLTNTLRFKHAVCVNLPSARKPYGLEIRGLLTAKTDNTELCGSDMCSLEDRVKQHYMWEHDEEYVKEMSKPDFDPHLDLALAAKAITQQEVQDYKNGNKLDRISQLRYNYKGGNYALQYGAGIKTLAKQLGITMKEAKVISEAYWERNWSVKAISDSMVTKEVEGSTWQFNPVSKLWYSLRSDKDKFSTLCQGTGTYLFDMWVGFILKEREQLTANFHDEIILEVKKGNRDKCVKLLENSIKKVNRMLKLNRELQVDVQFGVNYSEIH